MLPKVAKRPKRQGLGPYSKKTKFLDQNFFWSFLAFFDHFLAVFGQNFMKERHLGKIFFCQLSRMVILHRICYAHFEIPKKVFSEPVYYAPSQANHLSTHFKLHIGVKTKKCNQCDYASYAGNLRKHLKAHSKEKLNKCN